MAIFEGNLLGEGGARKAAGWGFGARFFAGEKCCCSVEKAGRLSCESGREVGSCADSRVGGRTAEADSRVGGRRVVDAFKTVEEDFVRVWPGTRVAADTELVEAFRRCRDWVRGGLERSCLTGSVIEDVALELRVEDDRFKPPVVGLLILAREGGGCKEEALLVALPVALGGLEVVLRVDGLTGSRLGD